MSINTVDVPSYELLSTVDIFEIKVNVHSRSMCFHHQRIINKRFPSANPFRFTQRTLMNMIYKHSNISYLYLQINSCSIKAH